MIKVLFQDRCHLDHPFFPLKCRICFQVEKRNIFSDRGNVLHPLNSDEEEDGYDSPHARRRGASVDEFLRGSELGRQVTKQKHESYSSKQCLVSRTNTYLRSKVQHSCSKKVQNLVILFWFQVLDTKDRKVLTN